MPRQRTPPSHPRPQNPYNPKPGKFRSITLIIRLVARASAIEQIRRFVVPGPIIVVLVGLSKGHEPPTCHRPAFGGRCLAVHRIGALLPSGGRPACHVQQIREFAREIPAARDSEFPQLTRLLLRRHIEGPAPHTTTGRPSVSSRWPCCNATALQVYERLRHRKSRDPSARN